MADELSREATFIGQVASVRGGVVTVRLRETPTTLVMVGGHAYRVGQVGAFLRIPLGYTQLYGVCTQVGADAIPSAEIGADPLALERDTDRRLSGFRWLSLALFGEAVGGAFDRGIGQYPTVGDEVHLVTPQDLDVIYARSQPGDDGITIGRIADSDGIPASLKTSALVSRHACVVGSTGAGKSNLVAVLLESLTKGNYPRARVLVIDPHGEYGDVLGNRARRIATGPESRGDPCRLRVPYWALPLEHLLDLTMGALQPGVLEAIRERVRDMKLEASKHLRNPPPVEAITADSPIPFSVRRLWYELEDIERATFSVANGQTEEKKLKREADGSPNTLTPPVYPAASPYNQEPYFNRQRRSISRQLDMLRSRLLDTRFAFMFDPDDALHPDLEGRIQEDLGALIASWVGNDKQVTVVDVSGIPSDVIGTVVGTMMHIVYDALYWGMELPVGGRQQPLLVVVDEAHRFLPGGGGGVAAAVFSKVAKEGRKYGVGLLVVTQRPSDVDPAVLSQCGTMIALRVTSPSDKAAVSAVVPDDLGGLTALIPALRTGEAIVLGEAMQVPSRVRIDRATVKPAGGDPALPGAWQHGQQASADVYEEAVGNWRAQTTAASPMVGAAVSPSDGTQDQGETEQPKHPSEEGS
ncbi:MAG: ATPase [Frondihabitans sp.]|nr:ATPase [Frondihabitans sp.]